jgi:hypothetical protein
MNASNSPHPRAPNRRSRALLLGLGGIALVALVATRVRSSSSTLSANAGIERERPGASSAALPLATFAPSPHVSSSTAASAAPAAGEPRPAHCPRYEPAMARGRYLANAKNYGAAAAAFAEALDARPFDARAWAELGYAHLMNGDSPEVAFRFAHSLALAQNDRVLLAQIWFNDATHRERIGKPDEARLALAAAAQYGSTAASTKLAGASRCAASWKVEDAPSPALATSWRALLEQRGPLPLCEREEPTPANEAQAKQIVCRGCGYGSHDEGDECLGPAPWVIRTGYQHFHHFYFYVEPLPGGLFYAEPLGDTPTPSAHLVNGRVLTVERPDTWETVGGLLGGPSESEPDSAGAAGARPPRCEPETHSSAELGTASGADGEPTLRMHEPREKKVYDLRRNRHVLTLIEWAGPVEVTLEGDAARLKGAGCDERVPLAP